MQHPASILPHVTASIVAMQEYSHILTSFLAMFEHQFGDIEIKKMWQSKSPKIATALAVAYTFVQVGSTGRAWEAGARTGKGEWES